MHTLGQISEIWDKVPEIKTETKKKCNSLELFGTDQTLTLSTFSGLTEMSSMGST